MVKTTTDNSTARLEARIPSDVYETMQRAAKLSGMTMTSFIVTTMGKRAAEIVEEADILRLSREDQVRFAEALLNPPPANARLRRAARRHAEMIAPR